MEKILVLGGDGYCGWPLCLRLSAGGHDVMIVDNGSRRKIGKDLGVISLVPITSIETRIAAWNEISGAEMSYRRIDISEEFEALAELLRAFQPNVIIHLAEQRSVPYSMDTRAGALYTARNNFMGTTHLLEAMVDADCDAHLIHLGSIGVYGYETLGYEIPEGYQMVRRVQADGALASPERMLHPFNPVSKYHLTKALDHVNLTYYASAHGLRITDLHQGTVWGAETKDTAKDPRLANRFDYDAIYGTVLNRYALQSVLGLPISVYGTGQQTRGFIHLDDVLDCIEATIATPPQAGEPVRVINEIAQTLSISALADLFSKLSGAPIRFLRSPRSEPESNLLEARNDGLKALGITPRLISAENVAHLLSFVRQYAGRADSECIYPEGVELSEILAK